MSVKEEQIELFIVEDLEADSDRLLESCAEVKWLHPVVFSTPEEAVRRMKKRVPDVLSLDLMFTSEYGSSFLGYWALEKVRRADPAVGVVVVSEHPGEKENAAKRLIDSFITKEQLTNDPSVYISAIKRAARRKVYKSLYDSFETITNINNELGKELLELLMTVDAEDSSKELLKKVKHKTLHESLKENIGRLAGNLCKTTNLQLDMLSLVEAFVRPRSSARPVTASLPSESKQGREVQFQIDIGPVNVCPNNEDGYLTFKGKTNSLQLHVHGNGFKVSDARRVLDMPRPDESLKVEMPVCPIKLGLLRLVVEFFVNGMRVGYTWAETTVEE